MDITKRSCSTSPCEGIHGRPKPRSDASSSSRELSRICYTITVASYRESSYNRADCSGACLRPWRRVLDTRGGHTACRHVRNRPAHFCYDLVVVKRMLEIDGKYRSDSLGCEILGTRLRRRERQERKKEISRACYVGDRFRHITERPEITPVLLNRSAHQLGHTTGKSVHCRIGGLHESMKSIGARSDRFGKEAQNGR